MTRSHGWASSAGTHVTTRPTLRWPCPYQRSLDATRPGDTTPRIMGSTGGVSHAGPGDHSSLIRNYEKGNGGFVAVFPPARGALLPTPTAHDGSSNGISAAS